MSGPVLVLGPQRPQPNLTEALRSNGLDGNVLTITAGWRHDEADDRALRDAIEAAGAKPVSLPLYAWFEEISRSEPELAAAYRERQAKILAYKELYRVRLAQALGTVHKLHETDVGDAELVREETERALADVRRIDAQVLARVAEIREAHREVARPWENERALARHQELKDLLGGACAVAIAGGHVAVLQSRLLFFGLEVLLPKANTAGTAVVAWSAGAMALTDRIVLYYDDPPEGPTEAEVLDTGIELVRRAVFFPHARRRLRITDVERISTLAARFAPATCLGIENGAWLERRGGKWISKGDPGSAILLRRDGAVVPLEERE